LRIYIWKLALPGPRIVHLRKIRLPTDPDPDWWVRVRSDRAIRGPPGPAPHSDELDDEAGSDYDYFDLDEDDIDRLDRDTAAKRLLTPEHTFKGGMSREEAKEILLLPKSSHSKIPRRDYPQVLCGFVSNNPTSIPAILHVCRESAAVTRKTYVPLIGTDGRALITYFDKKRDTLYLDKHSVRENRSRPWSWMRTHSLAWLLEEELLRDSLVGIENLAFHSIPFLKDFYSRRQGRQRIKWLIPLQRNFPGLKKLTIVDELYAHKSQPAGYENEDFYKNLKFDDLPSPDSSGDFRLHGYRIYRELISEIAFRARVFPKEAFVERVRKEWNKTNPSAQPWEFPQVEYKTLTTDADEKLLLLEAFEFERLHRRGLWYINPEDPNDYDDFPVDGDEKFNALLGE